MMKISEIEALLGARRLFDTAALEKKWNTPLHPIL